MSTQPTVVLVHGAFADSSSWNGVAADLAGRGFHVIAAANPLRGLGSDSAAVKALVQSIDGPVVLAGHSYGGAVITNAAAGEPNVKALVYVAGFLPDEGESALELTNKFPGATLGETLQTVKLADGNTDFYVRQELFRNQFAADVPEAQAALMAVTQRPVTEAALTETSGVPAWRTVPAWSLIPTGDKNIPLAAQEFMAQRADAEVVKVADASHAVLVSRPDKVADLIAAAAR
ncbi:alpha/beta fold hydrolase [Kutzneria buriramensis]|uniref:Pimeloyl-ACP methyl ester carboxylesterase n=1 Tax=Kutzneria buriramensis TaxID=1045776 RepID=A0A3E0H197_9PSEU|nr:alpha/beta hydrolase [Kutzneria buriramensis]REH35333.1 pimeloyl-ACP methyl ester carboxylesterase [Kutzneria buriramensis]